MADLHFILLIMSTLSVGGYFNRDTEIEKSIAKYNDEFLNANHLKSSIIKTFAIIEDLDLPLDSIWFRKSNTYPTGSVYQSDAHDRAPQCRY